MRKINHPTKEQLEQWYCVERKSTVWIAKECEVTSPGVRRWLKKFNIPTRSNSDAQRVSNGTHFVTKDIIEKLYIQDGLTQKQIAEKFGISQTAISHYMIRFGIPSNRKMFGNKNGMFGRKHSQESIQKIRDAHARQFSDPAMRERFSNNTADQIARGQTGKSYNKLENRVAEMLDAQDQVYVRQYRLGKYSFDFYVPETNTLIEANGTFWHADPRFYDHGNLSKIQSRNVANDIQKAIYAVKSGYKLRIIWEADI